MTPEALVVATIVGILAGTHTATWGMYKDAPHEGFRHYPRSIWVSTLSAPVIAWVLGLGISGRDLFVLFGVTYCVERGLTEFWKTFGCVLKEGVIDDATNKDRVAKLLRFTSTQVLDGQTVAFADYVSRMKPEQKAIYYVTADTVAAAKNSPQLEGFLAQGFEVLLLTDRIDEWLMSYLPEFDGKQFVDVARGDLDLGQLDSEEDKKAQEEVAKAKEGLIERLKGALGEQVAEVRVSHRLTDSPAILAIGEQDLGLQMRQILEATGQKVPESKPIFEINPQHPLIEKLDMEADEDRFADLSHILFDQAALAAGDSLKDPAAYVQRLNKLLVELSA